MAIEMARKLFPACANLDLHNWVGIDVEFWDNGTWKNRVNALSVGIQLLGIVVGVGHLHPGTLREQTERKRE